MQLQKHMQPREKAQAGVPNDSYHEMSTESTSPSKQRRRRRRKKGRKKRLSSDVSSSSDYSLPSFVEESSDDISDESSYLSDDQLEMIMAKYGPQLKTLCLSGSEYLTDAPWVSR